MVVTPGWMHARARNFHAKIIPGVISAFAGQAAARLVLPAYTGNPPFAQGSGPPDHNVSETRFAQEGFLLRLPSVHGWTFVLDRDPSGRAARRVLARVVDGSAAICPLPPGAWGTANKGRRADGGSRFPQAGPTPGTGGKVVAPPETQESRRPGLLHRGRVLRE